MDNTPSPSVRPKQAAAFLGIGESTFWRLTRSSPDFPKPSRPSAGITLFRLDELAAWREAKREQRLPPPREQRGVKPTAMQEAA